MLKRTIEREMSWMLAAIQIFVIFVFMVQVILCVRDRVARKESAYTLRLWSRSEKITLLIAENVAVITLATMLFEWIMSRLPDGTDTFVPGVIVSVLCVIALIVDNWFAGKRWNKKLAE